jgi:hypothetical protein
MIQPIIVGTVFTKKSEQKSFKDKATGQTNEYVNHSIDMICEKPQKGVCTVKVYPKDREALDVALEEGKQYEVAITSFSVEKGVPVIIANEQNFKLLK